MPVTDLVHATTVMREFKFSALLHHYIVGGKIYIQDVDVWSGDRDRGIVICGSFIICSFCEKYDGTWGSIRFFWVIIGFVKVPEQILYPYFIEQKAAIWYAWSITGSGDHVSCNKSRIIQDVTQEIPLGFTPDAASVCSFSAHPESAAHELWKEKDRLSLFPPDDVAVRRGILFNIKQSPERLTDRLFVGDYHISQVF
ncbi:hypothetical protein [Enterobacter hormaechei]|uniref:hypothetical protein n=1 Tax=Enterobacter hormaechei TaxID=158836 RepID=UPI0032DA0357